MRLKCVSALVMAGLLCCGVASGAAHAQAAMQESKYVSLPANSGAMLTDAKIVITYCAPQMHGRTIFGGLVPYGKVWRTGANAATTLKTSGDLTIGDLKVPAGTYTLYTVPAENGWTLIVNKQTGQWGTEYDQSQDLGRVPMEVAATTTEVETFNISFDKTIGDATEMHLKWANVDASVPVRATK